MNTTDDTTTGDTAEEMGVIAELIERGAVRGARARLARLLDTADVSSRLLLVACVEALEQEHPTTMMERLRTQWRRADEGGRALVEACAPSAERRAEKARDADRGARENRAKDRAWAARAPRDLTRRRSTPQGRRDPRDVERDTTARRYFLDRVDPVEDTDEAPRDDRLDYDLAAVPAMRGLPCVACGVERASRDQQRSRDDGLCEDCRDSGRAGVPILSQGASRADVLTARCQHIADSSQSTAERDARLRRDWRHLRTRDRFVVAGWVAQNP
ncbi:hypothetical protein [Pseudonocardia sp. KRD291]|uniref:hypothetical protein n=1 Tax=Pseudonocardia sp. KRD291 TaxID=2792007 RepID=UPI001C4A2E0E|nr:hypothetical protein [Pseudonocardia sp. KRD291]MBW0102948.1 hypothetical protein [Pseudonocardia sp. KRD291]